MSKLQRFLLLLLILLPAFWLRIFLLDGQSLWWDEGISLHLATSSFAEIAANRAANIHPPLYFFLLKIWVTLTGTTPFAARYFSALASFLQVALVYAVLRDWFGRRTAVIGLVLTAVWSLSVVYGQETRVYAFLPLTYLLVLLLAHRVALNQPTRRTWLALGVAEWLALTYGLYALIWIALTLTLSLLSRNARTALAGLLGLWLLATIIGPRLATNAAVQLAPRPSPEAFWAEVRVSVVSAAQAVIERERFFAPFGPEGPGRALLTLALDDSDPTVREASVSSAPVTRQITMMPARPAKRDRGEFWSLFRNDIKSGNSQNIV